MSNNHTSGESPLLSRHELLTTQMARLRQSVNQSVNQSAMTVVHNLSQLDANLQASITHIYTRHIERNKLSNNEVDVAQLRSVIHSINQQQSRDFIHSAVKVAQQLHQSVDQSFKQAIDQSKLLITIPSADQLIDQCEWWTSEQPLGLPLPSNQLSIRHINQSIQQSIQQPNRSPVSSHHPSVIQPVNQPSSFPVAQQPSTQQPALPNKQSVDNRPSAWPPQPQNGSSHHASQSTGQRFNHTSNGIASQSTNQPPARVMSQSANHSVGQPASTSNQSLSFQSFGPPASHANDQSVTQPSQSNQQHLPLHSTRSSPPVLHPAHAAPITKPAARDAFVKPPPSKYREDTSNHTNQSNPRGRAADNPWTRSKPQTDRRGRDYDDEDAPQRGSRKRATHSDSDEEADNHFRSRRPQRAAADKDVDDAPARRESPFMSGRDKLVIDAAKKGQKVDLQRPAAAPAPKSRRFNPPRPVGSNLDGQVNPMVAAALKGSGNADDPYAEFEPAIAERLRAFDPKLVESIRREEMETSRVTWDDVAGLEFAKAAVKEAVILPMKRPDLFTGIREPPKGMLLFGPPGTGKTLIGQAMASEAGAKFYSISASSLTSKWHGEGEKLVRTLFGVAACFPPAIIFIDEIDSLLTARTDGEFEASRRMKTELLVQMEGATSKSDDRVLVLGATNRPQDLDDAAKRRLVKRLYIPLPNNAARLQLMRRALGTVQHTISDADFEMVAQRTKGYSGADLKSLCREAAMEPLRCMSQAYDSTDVPRDVTVDDMLKAITQVKASVATKDLESLEEWDRAYGMQVKHVDD